MKEKLQGGLAKIKGFYSGEQKKKRIIISAIALVLVLAVSVFGAVKLNTKNYITLLTGLNSSDMSAVTAKLEEYETVDYKIDGDTILIEESQEPNIRAKLVVDGYPESGFGYDTYFSQINVLTSESARQTAILYELQDRMAATIRCFDGVSEAVVNIALGSDNRYILDSENSTNASASVFVTMNDNEEISQKYVDAIGNLMRTAVQGLEFESITITDSLGNSYVPSSDDEETSTATATDLKLRLEEQVNDRIRKEVLQAITPLYGAENVYVSVTSTVDTSKKVQESVEYSSPEDAPEGEGIIGWREYDQQLARPTDDENGGVVGAEPNEEADIPTYMENQGAVQGNETYIQNSGTEEINVNKVTEQSQMNSGVVTDVMIAVTINQEAAGNVGTEQIVNHVARAAGINVEDQADKINILIAPFYNPEAEQQNEENTTNVGGINLPPVAIYAIAGALGFLLFIIIIILIIKRKRKKARIKRELEEQQALEEAAALEAAIAAENGALDPEDEEAAKRGILDIKNERNMELRQEIRKFADENPEIVASMLRVWLKGEGENNA